MSQTHAAAAGGSPAYETLASPQAVMQHEGSPTRMIDTEAREQVDDAEPRGSSQPTESHDVDENYGYSPDEKRGTKRKRGSAYSTEEYDFEGHRSRSRSRLSQSDQSGSRSELRHSLSPHLEPPQRSPSPRFATSQDVADLPTTLLSPEVQDSQEDMRLDETSSDTVSHLLNVSPQPPSLRPSPAAEPARQQVYIIGAPPPIRIVSFDFGSDAEDMAIDATASPAKARIPEDFIRFKQEYSLPPLSTLPAEFQRRSASSRNKKKRDKEKQERAGDKGEGRRDDWTPMGINKWGALLRANPVWKKLSKASKCVSTHEWNVRCLSRRMSSIH